MSELYLAAFIPGIVLAMLFSLVVLAACLWRPAWGGEKRSSSWADRVRTLRGLVPPLILFLLVVGSIYAGVATPTEASALGVIAALLFALWRRALNWKMLGECFEGTARTTCMVMLIVVAAFFLNFVMSSIGLINAVTAVVTSLDWSPIWVMLGIIGFYLVLGCFMETLSLMIATTPIVVPIIKVIGYDPIWFGVVYMILLEVALITPPVGVNLFVVQSVRGGGSLREVMTGVTPFVLTMICMIGLLLAFPELATFLPSLLATKS